MQEGTQVTLNPTAVGELAGEGDINWDLPRSMQYTPNTELSPRCSVVNTSSTTKVYAIAFYVLNKDKNIIHEQLLSFDGYQAFQMLPNRAMEFTLRFSLNTKDVYVALALFTCTQAGGGWVLDREVDRVECFLGTASIDIGSILGMMIPVMMMGMMVPMIGKMAE